MSKYTILAIALLIALVAALVITARHSRDTAEQYKRQRDDAQHALAIAQAKSEALQNRLRAAAELDAKYTREIADAEANIDKLERDIRAGKRRLQLNATCQSSDSASGRLGNAATAGLTDTAERNYFLLRKGLLHVTAQVNYLQGYISTQCQRQYSR